MLSLRSDALVSSNSLPLFLSRTASLDDATGDLESFRRLSLLRSRGLLES